MLIPRDPDTPEVWLRDGDRVMAHVNPAYVDPKLPHHVPQFIGVQLSARAGRYPWEAALSARVSEGLDFDARRTLIR